MNKIQKFLNLNGCSDGDKTSKKKKILCLHGGQQNFSSFEFMLRDFTNDLNDEFDFIFADSPIKNDVWYEDKPGGKQSDQETGEDWADQSVRYLDELISNTGTVDSIIAFSQGVPMSLVLLSKRNYIPAIKKLILLNGYLPTTHKGLTKLIERNSKFSNNT